MLPPSYNAAFAWSLGALLVPAIATQRPPLSTTSTTHSQEPAGHAPASQTPAADLLELLTLEQIDLDLFLGQNEQRGTPRLFGGQVLAQALRAACATVEMSGESPRSPHSLHGYFLRPGNPGRPVLYEIDRIRDGRSFTTRRVVAIQDGKAILNMSVSMQVAEEGMTHAQLMPNVPPPEELQDDLEQALELPADFRDLSPMARLPRAFQMRSVIVPWEQGDRQFSPVWMRFTERFDASDSALNHALLAYASDLGLVSTAALPHNTAAPRNTLMLASLDHALWIHRQPKLDDWILFAKRTSTATGARGLSHAEFYTRDGELIASVTQEGLLRPRRDEKSSHAPS